MKKWISLLLTAAMLLTRADCGTMNADNEAASNSDNPSAEETVDLIPTEEMMEETSYEEDFPSRTTRRSCRR